MRGPPPMPTHLKLLRGNPGKRPIRPEPEPVVSEQVPPPPALLTGYALDEWNRVAPELHRIRLLSVLDLQILALYCLSYKRWRDCEEVLRSMAERDPATSALLIRRRDGSVGRNPIVKMSSHAAQQMIAAAGHFGMSPAARARIAAGIGYEPPPSKFDGLFA
jgi:P27 family predicted phage terminase small subunit